MPVTPFTIPQDKEFSILITGAGGYIGKELLKQLHALGRESDTIVALDIRELPAEYRFEDFHYETLDIRAPELGQLLENYAIDTVVHLASIVTPSKSMTREFVYSVDVGGTENILKACVAKNVQRFIFTSSGAAYGYYPDNPEYLVETDPIRGNEEFAYSHHKRLIEELLARYREEHPELKQLILRPGTILGENVSNQITALFEKKNVIGLRGATTPFVFIWDKDVVGSIIMGIYEEKTGIYNLAGDGTLSMKEIAEIMGKKYKPLPVWLVKFSLWFMKLFRMTQYGPEQVNFLRYRPVLSNKRLKEEFGYIPQLTTKEVFLKYYRSHQNTSPEIA